MPGQPQSMDKRNKKEALQLQKDLIKESLNKVDDLLRIPQSTSLNALPTTSLKPDSSPVAKPETHQLSQSLSSFQRPSLYYNWRSFSYVDNDDINLGKNETLDDLENGEEFLPSSLDELLTPLERRRKHSSRTSSISSVFTLSPAINTTQQLPTPAMNNMENSTLTLKPRTHEDDATQFDLDLEL